MPAGGCDVWLYSVAAASELCRSSGCAGATLPGRDGFCPCIRSVLISWYVGAEPASLRIHSETTGQRDSGRPFLVGSDLDFNVSHCAGLFALAIVQGGRVGVDVETERDAEATAALAEIALVPRERVLLDQHADDASRARVLAALWCRKEAASKYSGHGLDFPVGILDVVDPRVSAVSSFDSYALEARLHSFRSRSGAWGAVAVGLDVDRVSLFDASGSP